MRQRPIEQEPLSLDRTCPQHAVTDETVADPDHDRNFADAPCSRDGGRENLWRGLDPPHDLQKTHNICWAEKMHADDCLRPCGAFGDYINVEIRRVGGKHRIGAGEPVKLSEYFLFYRHFLEYGFDDEVDIFNRGDVSDAVDQAHASRDVFIA